MERGRAADTALSVKAGTDFTCVSCEEYRGLPAQLLGSTAPQDVPTRWDHRHYGYEKPNLGQIESPRAWQWTRMDSAPEDLRVRGEVRGETVLAGELTKHI